MLSQELEETLKRNEDLESQLALSNRSLQVTMMCVCTCACVCVCVCMEWLSACQHLTHYSMKISHDAHLTATQILKNVHDIICLSFVVDVQIMKENLQKSTSSSQETAKSLEASQEALKIARAEKQQLLHDLTKAKKEMKNVPPESSAEIEKLTQNLSIAQKGLKMANDENERLKMEREAEAKEITGLRSHLQEAQSALADAQAEVCSSVPSVVRLCFLSCHQDFQC